LKLEGFWWIGGVISTTTGSMKQKVWKKIETLLGNKKRKWKSDEWRKGEGFARVLQTKQHNNNTHKNKIGKNISIIYSTIYFGNLRLISNLFFFYYY
jgi:hypothetical protein